MTWVQRYRVRHYVTNSIWIVPLLSMAAALAAVPVLHRFEAALGWESEGNVETVRVLLGTVASSLFTFIVFVSSALLIAVQLASAQLSPRVIGIVFKDPVMKFSLTLFVFVFTFSLAVLVRIDTTVPQLTARMSAYGFVLSLGVFLFLIDHVGKALRPSGALRAVALLGRNVIESVYPKQLIDLPEAAQNPVHGLGDPSRMISSMKDGVILACDVTGLATLAERADCILEMVPQVGDFVAVGDPLFRIFRGGAELTPGRLRQMVAIGQERTLEQDPTFAFRILVDVASKGLSPAINDPTTAVLAIDQIHHLLRNVGQRHLDDERVRDRSGHLRLIYRTPGWEDFVHLAVTEIRHFGGASIQVARRLRAMLENLIATLPEVRAPILRRELSLLERSAARFFLEPEDKALAEISDSQGVGSNCGHAPALAENRNSKTLSGPSGNVPPSSPR
jgi:uncharacterized membrane protein